MNPEDGLDQAHHEVRHAVPAGCCNCFTGHAHVHRPSNKHCDDRDDAVEEEEEHERDHQVDYDANSRIEILGPERLLHLHTGRARGLKGGEEARARAGGWGGGGALQP